MLKTALVILGLCFLAELIFPWWSIAVVAFAVGFVKSVSGRKAFVAGFWGVSLLWLITAGFIHFKTAGILTTRVGEMLSLPLPNLVLLLTSAVGGFVGGFSAMTGFYLKNALS